jgi:protein-tyrosine phosphatase
MIDIHCHVLPGLDDGSKDLETSVAMCKMAAEDGIEAIVCTPHSNDEYDFDPDVIREKIQELNAQTGGVPRLYQGCDFHLSYENIQGALADRRRYTINQGMYLLVEFGDFAVPPNMADVFFDLQSRGVVPIITHPERNAWLMSRRTDLVKWLDAGALLQVTAGSLLGRFGKSAGRFCSWLLDRQMVHFVATDSHNVTSRPPLLSAAYKQVAASHGVETAEALFRKNPRSVLDNRYFDVPRHTDRPSRGLLSRITEAFRSR